MLYNTILVFAAVLLSFLSRANTSDDLCQLIELQVSDEKLNWQFDQLQQRLFYRTESFCENKPIFRSLYYENLYQFKSKNNRWWTLYQTTNISTTVGTRKWCDAWNMQPILSMPIGLFQQPWTKAKRYQRWKRVFLDENNRTFTYKSRTNIYLKCYYPESQSTCQTRQLTFLFDLTRTTSHDDLRQMQSWSKILIWLLYNQTQIALSTYSDTFRIVKTFEKRTVEHLYDLIDTIDGDGEERGRRSSVPWYETIHRIVTTMFHRRLFLPVEPIEQIDKTQMASNESSEEIIYTEPYPLIVDDDQAVKTLLNISTLINRTRRALERTIPRSKQVLVILTSRAKSLYDYTKKERRLSEWIASVPVRIVLVDFHRLSNRYTAESVHSMFIHHAKYALASYPPSWNYINAFDDADDLLHGDQLFAHYDRLCNEFNETKSSSKFIEIKTNTMNVCPLIRFSLFNEGNQTLNQLVHSIFYQTDDQCFSSFVYRSLGDRNLYMQRLSTGHWVVTRVDPLLPSTWTRIEEKKLISTTTMHPDLIDADDYAMGPMLDENLGEIIDDHWPTSVPHCSNTPGLNNLWENEQNQQSIVELQRWFSTENRSISVQSSCNQYKISCSSEQFDLLIVLNVEEKYSTFLRTFLRTFFGLIAPSTHRFSVSVLTSNSVDPFEIHLPLTSIDQLNFNIVEQFLYRLDQENRSSTLFVHQLEQLTDYMKRNQRSSSTLPSTILTISSRFDFDRSAVQNLTHLDSTVRYITIDPQLKIDHRYNLQRLRSLRSLASKPEDSNVFQVFSANRDLTFDTILRIFERFCGNFQE